MRSLIVCLLLVGCAKKVPVDPTIELPPTLAEASIFRDFDAFDRLSEQGRPDVRKNQWVAIPSETQVDRLRAGGNPSVPFLLGRYVTSTKDSTQVLTIQGKPQFVPHSVVLPIPPRSPVQIGDFLYGIDRSRTRPVMRMGHTTSVSGETPTVRFIESSFDGEALLDPGTFFRIEGPWSLGSMLACRHDDGPWRALTLLKLEEDYVLGSLTGGRIRGYPRASCRPSDPNKRVVEGQRLMVPVLGELLVSTVTDANPEPGRMTVKVDVTGESLTLWTAASITPP